MANTNSSAHVRVIEETPAYGGLVRLPAFQHRRRQHIRSLTGSARANERQAPSLRVVVFESANPEFYLAHFDLTGKIGNILTAVGASGLRS